MLLKISFIILTVFGIAFVISESIGRAQSLIASPKAKLCKALPVADIEAVVGTKLTRKSGSDMEKYSSCTAFFGDASAKIEYHQPGQVGLPTDVKSGLAGATAMVGSKIEDSRDFGKIGCYQMTIMAVKSTACFLPKGYYTLSVGGSLANFVPMEKVKDLLKKTVAAAR